MAFLEEKNALRLCMNLAVVVLVALAFTATSMQRMGEINRKDFKIQQTWSDQQKATIISKGTEGMWLNRTGWPRGDWKTVNNFYNGVDFQNQSTEPVYSSSQKSFKQRLTQSWLIQDESGRTVMTKYGVQSRPGAFVHIDFGRLHKARHHDFFAITIRDPFSRFLSVFTFMHPQNVRARKGCNREFCKTGSAWECFPSVNDFAWHLASNGTSKSIDGNLTSQIRIQDSPANESVHTLNCSEVAQQWIGGGQVDAPAHFRFGTRTVVDEYLPPGSVFNSTILVIRNEYLWEDWIATNEWLGQEKGTVATFPLDAVRDFSQLKLPVTKELSDDSRQILCTFLQDEYRAYLQVLRMP
ncbi:predicted protein [Phaeodactylum tricornutum CCAP 1055/1]|uniref:Uncharacterized protein n=1 Tax=Phaeodactylum tricornutum (strain CCAP 1055/1) TaxID=556484 RepID=B7GBD8_PHATC|nr:predicted protein [Phaeodactylum tricornutum CCAP 1055/1]EEC44197.1 predicted protein [Phaeodactylum tricornutum CCAP 1055/1]|eukprot:XP_002184448.1 predicted protein [Phaeodactylum tricornutum CCAP 1055/1]